MSDSGWSRLWRPAAQRNMRNVWADIAAARSEWSASSTKGLSIATALVNAFLTQSYLPDMDLSKLENMKGIREKASKKLESQQVKYLYNLIDIYKNQVGVVSKLIESLKSMRVYRTSLEGPLIEFSRHRMLEGDNGDGGGIPVFSTLSIPFFESLAMELVEMYVLELKVKWYVLSGLIVAVLTSENAKKLGSVMPCQPTFSLMASSSQSPHAEENFNASVGFEAIQGVDKSPHPNNREVLQMKASFCIFATIECIMHICCMETMMIRFCGKQPGKMKDK